MLSPTAGLGNSDAIIPSSEPTTSTALPTTSLPVNTRQDPTFTPFPVSTELPSGSAPPTPTASAGPDFTPTSDDPATATPAPTPEITPTVTRKPRPKLTATPKPASDEHFGVIAPAVGDLLSYQLDELGVKWFIDYQPDPSKAPPGTTHVPYIDLTLARLSSETLIEYATAAPGSVWYIGGEPNVGGMTGADYVVEFDYYVEAIMEADPTAKIMSASILNWDFTCTGCVGFQSGESWMREFISAYQTSHSGELPPVDIWAIDAYPLRWDEVPMIDWFTVVQQISGFRDYLDTELFRSSDPIWVTEIASHWAYSAWTRLDGGITIPPELDWDLDYRWDDMLNYLTKTIDWLRANALGMKIEKWFFYRNFIDVTQSQYGDPYAGIYFFESDADDSPLNQLGQLYKDYATGRR